MRAYTSPLSKSCSSFPGDADQTPPPFPLQRGLYSVESIPRIDAGVVAIGERQPEGVVSDELDVRDANIVGHRIDVEGADSCPLVNATGAATLTPKPFCAIAVGRCVAPGYLQYSFRSLQLDVPWCVAHDRSLNRALSKRHDSGKWPLNQESVFGNLAKPLAVLVYYVSDPPPGEYRGRCSERYRAE